LYATARLLKNHEAYGHDTVPAMNLHSNLTPEQQAQLGLYGSGMGYGKGMHTRRPKRGIYGNNGHRDRGKTYYDTF
jgi:hypothetical protein